MRSGWTRIDPFPASFLRMKETPSFAVLLPLLLLAAAPMLRAAPPALDVPHATSAPVLDGDLSETAWATAAVIGKLLPPLGSSTDAGDAAPLPTTVRVLWDAEALYVAFSCDDPDVLCSGTLGHDGNLYTEDVAEVFLDAVGDARSFLEIEVAPDGTRISFPGTGTTSGGCSGTRMTKGYFIVMMHPSCTNRHCGKEIPHEGRSE